ncbi:uncharacterized protein LOC127703123 [Mytilus californianus]|uniref:uncharacterized protein LOC127703123 n=1 Tax=Mytilus californianus TaxID=6549 RepID=UPI0022461888|nr:uncharacterized protein LOC127703123 [Mytilus californianus]
MASRSLLILISLVTIGLFELVESTKIDPDAGLKYYIIGGTVLGIFFAIVVVSLYVLCWCCRLQKPKEDMTQLKTLDVRSRFSEATTPKHAVIASMAPRRDFMKKGDDPLPYKKKPRLLRREESYV